MEIGHKLKGLTDSVQQSTKSASSSLVHICFRVITGFFIGVVLSLIAQEIFKFDLLILTFLTIVFVAVIFKALGRMTIFQILVFDLICVLIALLLRMYIMLAP